MKLNDKPKIILWSMAAIMAALAIGNYLITIDGAINVVLATVFFVTSFSEIGKLIKKKEQVRQ